jgi:rRNA-processing protein FCF1
MLDSNAFDYIHDNKLTDKVRKAVNDGKVKLFTTDVQKQEIEKISNSTRKQGLTQTSEEIQVIFIATSGAVLGSDQEGKSGFGGSRVDQSRVIGDREAQLAETITRRGIRRQLKNSADVLTLFTAIKENMDCLVTNDADFEKSLNVLKMEIDTELRIIDYEYFRKLL